MCALPIFALLVLGGSAVAQDTNAPRLLDRTAWGAKPPHMGMRPHKPYSIIVHHTAQRQNPKRNPAEKLRGLQALAIGAKMLDGRILPPWPDLPYHYYIGVDGTIGEGRDVNFAGDTNTKYDTTGHVQVVLEGNFEIDKPTPEQVVALKRVLVWQAARWKVPISKISVHRDHTSTACPGRNMIAILPDILRELDPSYQPPAQKKKEP
ncbi:MAG: N-acetylmuramoyl-L-alanine amidase [Rhizobiales bacterium]|nr:N-acetylmuramoyl-L-alanine amidase [Hyphomicrobiales bacterium]